MKSVCIRRFSGPYSVPMREKTDQKISEYKQFLRSVYWLNFAKLILLYHCRMLSVNPIFFFYLSPKRKEDLEHIIENNYDMGNITVLVVMS